jgi:hypothetical protein
MNKAVLALGAVLALVLATSALGDDFSQGKGANAAPNWKILGKNPSGQEGTSKVAQSFADGIGFTFGTDPVDSKLFVTDHPDSPLLGDLSHANRLTATFTIAGTATGFTYWRTGPNSCPTPTDAAVGLYFDGNAIDPSSDEWWSNSQVSIVTSPVVGHTFTLSVPLDVADWSNHSLDTGSGVKDDFAAAVATVSAIGVSFGGGCGLYALTGGVAPTGGTASFVLKSYSIS